MGSLLLAVIYRNRHHAALLTDICDFEYQFAGNGVSKDNFSYCLNLKYAYCDTTSNPTLSAVALEPAFAASQSHTGSFPILSTFLIFRPIDALQPEDS